MHRAGEIVHKRKLEVSQDTPTKRVYNSKDSSISIDTSPKTLEVKVAEAEHRYEKAKELVSESKNNGDGLGTAAALGELHRTSEQLKEIYEEVYSNFKNDQAIGNAKEPDSIIDILKQNYSKEARSLMLAAHLKDVYHMDAGQCKQFDALQKAFVIVRGIDFENELQHVQPLSEDALAKIREKHNMRYQVDELGEISPPKGDESTGHRLGRKVIGYEEYCYQTDIYPEDNKLEIERCYKRRPLESQPEKDQEKLAKQGLYDEEVDPIIDGQKRTETTPLSHSHLIRCDFDYLAKLGKLDLSTFDAETMYDNSIINYETTRTMNLFVERESTRSFKKGEHGYYAALGTPMGKVKGRLAAESFSRVGFAEIDAYRVNRDDGYEYIGYHKYEDNNDSD